MGFDEALDFRAQGAVVGEALVKAMQKSQRACRQCSLAQAALSVWSRIGWMGRRAMRWRAGSVGGF